MSPCRPARRQGRDFGVRWKFGSKVVAEPTKPVDYNAGPKSTEFHLQNSGGFPPGDYSVDVLIDGVQVGSRVQGRTRVPYFVPQRQDRIDPARARRGNQARRRGDHRQQQHRPIAIHGSFGWIPYSCDET